MGGDPTSDLDAYAFSSETHIPIPIPEYKASQVADDFILETGAPIIGVTWWGSYWDPTTKDGTSVFPYDHSDSWGDPAQKPMPSQFNINFYNDTAAGTGIPPWSHPNSIVETFDIDAQDISEVLVGTIDRAGAVQSIYKYRAAIPGLALNPGTVYWIEIQAVLGGEPIQWGWQESIDHWNDNAVQMSFPPNAITSSWWHNIPGEDMAFEITVVPVPTTLLLLGSGLIGLIGFRRRFR
jgi:hypothetical protein